MPIPGSSKLSHGEPNAGKEAPVAAQGKAHGLPIRFSWNREAALLAALILLRTVVFTTLKWLRFRSFFAVEWQDSAAVLQIIRHTAHGNWFYQHITGECFLGHFEPIFLLPSAVYALLPHPVTVFAAASFGFSLGALPVYLWVKQRTEAPRAALGCAVAYLLYAPLNYANLSDVRGIAFCVAPLLFAFYFFEAKKPWRFLAAAVLAMSCKENVAFVIFLFGLLALIRGRRWPWVVWPALLGAAWFVVALKVVMPSILSGHKYSTDTYFNHWGGGGSALGLAATILGDPINHARLVLSQARLAAALAWLAPLCFLPLLAPDVLLLALPGLMQLALLRNSYFLHIRAHWFTIPSALMFAAGTYGMVRLLRSDHFLGRRFAKVKLGRAGLPWVVATGCLLSNVFDNMLTFPKVSEPIYDARFAQVRNMFDPRFYTWDEEDRRLWRIIQAIPPHASVAATAHLLPALAGRSVVMEMWTSTRGLREQPLRYSDCDYLLVDFRNYHHGGGWYRWPMGDETVEKLSRLMAHGGWRVVLEEKTTLLLKKDIRHHMDLRGVEAVAKRLMAEWLKVQGFAVHIERAARAYEKGDMRASRTEYLKAIETTRPDPYPYSQLCGVSLRLNDFHGAIAFGQMALRLNPRDVFTWFRVGLANMELGQMHEAIRCCKRALWRFPHSAQVRALLAELYERTGRPVAARRQVRIALKIKFDDEHARRVAKALGVRAPRLPNP